MGVRITPGRDKHCPPIDHNPLTSPLQDEISRTINTVRCTRMQSLATKNPLHQHTPLLSGYVSSVTYTYPGIAANYRTVDAIAPSITGMLQQYLQKFDSISISSPRSATPSSFLISTPLQSAKTPILRNTRRRYDVTKREWHGSRSAVGRI